MLNKKRQKVRWDHSDFLLSIIGYRCDRYLQFSLLNKRTQQQQKKHCRSSSITHLESRDFLIQRRKTKSNSISRWRIL